MMEEVAPPDASNARNRRIAVAVSGSGRSLENLLAQQDPASGYQVAAVIASRSDCRAVAVAQEHNLPIFIEEFRLTELPKIAAKLYPWLEEHHIGWITLAGFIRMFPLDAAWSGRTINIHPALLPKFGGQGMYGERVHQAVIEAGELVSGASVHYVNERYDEGRIIAQITVPIQASDDAQTLAARVFAGECRLYPQVVNMLIARQLPLANHEIYRLNYE